MTRLRQTLAWLLAAAALASTHAVQIHIKLHKDASLTTSNTTTTTAATSTSNATSTTNSSASSASNDVPATPANASDWRMTKVVTYHARIQSGAPAWDKQHEAWTGTFGKTFDATYLSVLDSVNTASIEGALMYLQAEGINAPEQSVKCHRKNNMQYILFYRLTIVQPTPALAYYSGSHDPEEYCPFIAMDSGMCTPAGTTIPDTCKQLEGLDGQPKLGACVGANEQSTDPRAPYPGNYWFSFPNSCPTKPWSGTDAKTDACRTQYPGGLCAFGVEPDGVNCTFSYSIIGFLNIDDLVGITDGTAAGGTKYGNFTEFCNAGNVEFSATNTGNGFQVQSSIPFWKDPGDKDANAARTQKMIDMYNKKVNATMEALPALTSLKNPPCYYNSKVCATATNGCRRKLYAQLCEVCSSAAADCVKAPSTFKFPDLPKPKGTSTSNSSTGSNESGSLKASSKTGSGNGNGNGNGNAGKSASVGRASATIFATVMAVAAATLL